MTFNDRRVLKQVNEIRQAAGARPLAELAPGIRRDENRCVVANSLRDIDAAVHVGTRHTTFQGRKFQNPRSMRKLITRFDGGLKPSYVTHYFDLDDLIYAKEPGMTRKESRAARAAERKREHDERVREEREFQHKLQMAEVEIVKDRERERTKQREIDLRIAQERRAERETELTIMRERSLLERERMARLADMGEFDVRDLTPTPAAQ